MNNAYKIRNPSSLHHLIRVEPHQRIMVILSKQLYGDKPIVYSRGMKLRLVSEMSHDETTVFCFEQCWLKHDSAEYSSIHLGEIIITSVNVNAKLIVVAKSKTTSKMHHITVVNPQCTVMRLRPHEVLEIVLYDYDFRSHDEWFWQWKSNLPICMNQINYDNLSLYSWFLKHETVYEMKPADLFSCYPRFAQTANAACRQHHFWFMFDESIMDLLASNCGTKLIGAFNFFGRKDKREPSNQFTEYDITVYLDAHTKYQKHFLHSLAEYQERTKDILDCNNESTAGFVLPLSKAPPVVKLFPIRDVDLVCLKHKKLEEGCETKSVLPVKSLDYEPENSYEQWLTHDWEQYANNIHY